MDFSSFFGYLTISFLGITNSSISYLNYSGNPVADGLIVGEPLPIRSDEYLRWTPEYLGNYKYQNSGSILDVQQSADIEKSSQNISSIFLNLLTISDTKPNLIEKFFPLNSSFAFHWWFKIFLAFIFIPLLLKKFNVGLTLGIITTFLLFFHPTNVWWSFQPINILGITAAACFFSFLYLSNKQKSLKRSIYFALAVIFLFQLPFQYQPWSIPITLLIFPMTLYMAGSLNNEKLQFFKDTTKLIFSTLIIVLIKVYASKYIFEVLSETVYPGQRRIEVGQAQLPTFSTYLTSNLFSFGKYVKAANSSELAISFLELIILYLALMPVYFIHKKRSISARLLILSGGILFVYISWILGIFPNIPSNVNLLTLISQNRLAQISGFLAFFLLPLVISFARETKFIEQPFGRFCFLLGSAIVIFFVIRDFKVNSNFFDKHFIDLNYAIIFYFIFLCLIFILTIPNVNISATYLVFSIIFIFLNIGINPIQIGTSDIQTSQLAKKITEIERNNSGVWASSEITLDAILIANVEKTVTGQQPLGPNLSNWKILDPSESSKDAWNRAASFISIKWLDEPVSSIENPVNDVIQINMSPCDSKLKALKLKWILSSTPMNQECLINEAQISNSYQSYFIYRLNSN